MRAIDLEYKKEYRCGTNNRIVAFVFQNGKRYWFTNVSAKKPKTYWGDFWMSEKQIEDSLIEL